MADTSSTFLDTIMSSPRNQRRLFIASAAVLVAGVGAFLGLVVFRGTSNAFTDTFSNKPAQLSHPEKTVPVSAAQYSLARKFIHTAVARENLSAAYNIVDPDLKGRMTLAEWNKGNTPIIPYQAVNIDRAAFVVDYSYKTQAMMEIDLINKGDETRPHMLFFIGLKRQGGKADGRWLVNYWEPRWRPPVPEALH